MYKEAEWAQFEVLMDGKRIAGLRGLTYGKEWEAEHLHAAGNEPISIQRGNKKYEGTLKALKGDVDAMNDAARAKGYEDITDVEDLTITVAYLPKGTRLLRTDIQTGVHINKLEKGWDQGAKFMEISLPYMFTGLKQA